MTLPRDFADLPWDEHEHLGWRDPKAPLRGDAVLWRDGAPLGIAQRAAEHTVSRRRVAMCLLCQSTHSAERSPTSPPDGPARPDVTATPSASTSAPT
jgi:hypothetical protein